MNCDHREVTVPMCQLIVKWRSEAASIRRHPSRRLIMGPGLRPADPPSAIVRDRCANELEALLRSQQR